MDTWVVYESMFGNTRQVAEAIASGLDGAVTILPVNQAPGVVPPSVTLVVAGGPTHAFGMSRRSTRTDAVGRGASAGTGTANGLRDWLETLVLKPTVPVATFDTKVSRARWLPGSAGRGASRALARAGHESIVQAESFYCDDIAGPLLKGEVERARKWGVSLAEAATGGTGRHSRSG